jgi:hypothetical protein
MSSTNEKKIENAAFIERLAEACGTAEPAHISRLLNISYQAAKNYLTGVRYPSTDVLLRIAACTDISIHWLLTGEGKKFVDERAQDSAPLPPGQSEAFVRRVCVEVINETFGDKPNIVVLPPASLREEKAEQQTEPAFSERS